jgi:hypothetical protein
MAQFDEVQLPFTKRCRRRTIRRIRADAKKQVKRFRHLKSVDETVKRELLRSFRHRAIWLAEAKQLRRRLESLLRPLVLVPAVLSLCLAPIILRWQSSRLGLNFSISIAEFVMPSSENVLTTAGIIFTLLLPFLFLAIVSLTVPPRLRNDLLPPFVLVAIVMTLSCYLIILSNILFAARVAPPNAALQRAALTIVGFSSYFFVGFVLAFVASSVMNLFDKRMMKLMPDAFIIDGLMSALLLIETHPIGWPETEFKRMLIVRIERVALCMEYYLPNRLRSRDFFIDSWLQDTARKIAASVRSLIQWIYTPKGDTLGQINARLACIFVHSVRGDWDNLEKTTTESVPPRESLRARAKLIAIAGFSGVIPVLSIHVIKYLNLIDVTILKPLLVAAYLWAALTILSQLDPLYSVKLSSIKDIAQWLPFTGRGEKN